MLVYKASYTFDSDDNDGWVVGQVLDFPGAVTQGQGIDEARRMLASALADMAETLMFDGVALPKPDSTLSDSNADIEEPIYLLIDAATHVRIVPDDVPA